MRNKVIRYLSSQIYFFFVYSIFKDIFFMVLVSFWRNPDPDPYRLKRIRNTDFNSKSVPILVTVLLLLHTSPSTLDNRWWRDL